MTDTRKDAHASDCAMHNEPARANGPCDCNVSRKDALAVLLDKVSTGTAIETDFAEAWPNATHGEHFNAWLAYIGSLDGAKQLHDAVLPGREWRLRDDGRAWVWRTGTDVQGCEDANTTARAWLIAILSALIAEAGE